MKKTLPALLVFAIAIFYCSTGAFARDLPYGKIASCYYKSYGHEQHHRYRRAIQDLKPVYEAYPNTYTVNYRMGWLYYLNKNYRRALRHLNKALSILPHSLEVKNTITLVDAARHDWRRVEEESRRVIQTDPYNFTANYWYSRSLRMRHRYGSAIKVDRKMLAVFPTSASFLQELGINLFADHKQKESAAVFYDLKLLSPGNPTADTYLKKLQ